MREKRKKFFINRTGVGSERLVLIEGDVSGFLGCSHPGKPMAACSVLKTFEGAG